MQIRTPPEILAARRRGQISVAGMGVEPIIEELMRLPWFSVPLARNKLVRALGVEPSPPRSKRGRRPLPHTLKMVRTGGLEPPISCIRNRRVALTLRPEFGIVSGFVSLVARASRPQFKEKAGETPALPGNLGHYRIWSGIRNSNPFLQLGRLRHNLYANAAKNGAVSGNRTRAPTLAMSDSATKP